MKKSFIVFIKYFMISISFKITNRYFKNLTQLTDFFVQLTMIIYILFRI
jgi:hypothetical protein